jgi:5-methylcytosine-specific restriction endonuclease McrA
MIVSYCRPKTKQRLLDGEHIPWLDVDSKRRRRNMKQLIMSYSSWTNKKEIQDIVDECKLICEITGIKYVIDHIIPVNHPLVSGLTTPWNLQIITKAENDKKGNKWSDD